MKTTPFNLLWGSMFILISYTKERSKFSYWESSQCRKCHTFTNGENNCNSGTILY